MRDGVKALIRRIDDVVAYERSRLSGGFCHARLQSPTKRRLSRILLNAASAVSRVFCVAAVVLWMRSDEGHDVPWTERRWTSGRFWRVERAEYYAVDGVAGVVITDRRQVPTTLKSEGYVQAPGPITWTLSSTTGPHYRRGISPRRSYTQMYIPRRAGDAGWMLKDFMDGGVGRAIKLQNETAIFLALPLARLLLALRPKRPYPTGRACGYDLRATPERCPECGTVPKR